MDERRSLPAERGAVARVDTAPPLRCRHVESSSLFDGVRELVIAHNGDTYRLRLTRNEKMILTK